MADADGHDATRADAAEQRQVSVGRLRAGLRQLLAAARSSNDTSLQQHPALQALTPTIEEPAAAVHLQLQALAACLAHRKLRVLVVKHLRPFLLDLMVRLTDPALVLYEHEGEQYSECADSMRRSELLAATLAELLTYLPATSTLAQQYFETAPCFFALAEVAAAQKQQSAETLARLRRIAKTAFLLLRARPTELTALWNWTPFFPLSFHDDTRVRWFATRASALVLSMGNAQRNEFLKGLGVGEDAAVSGDSPTVRQIELELHSEDAIRQEQLIELSVYQEQDDSDTIETQPEPVPFHDSLQNIFGVVIPTSKLHQQRQIAADAAVTTEPLVPTPSTKRNLQSLAIALGLKRPILVAGPGGCGKTATIRELARLSGNGDMVELHLDDQIDSKTLLGSYVCTDVPGEFTWQPGALTTAVLAGRWVVIEDIDRAPFEVLAALMPLLETREMVLPGRGELLVAHPNFQIFGTTTHGHQMPKGFQESVWTSVGVAPLADSEIEQIMLTRFVKIPRQVVSKIMTTYNAVSGYASEEVGGPVQLWKETRRNYGRDFCLRDLLKWCKRIYRFAIMLRALLMKTHPPATITLLRTIVCVLLWKR
ncbi:midasin-like protein [Phytophthora cinnamomi]|uniref:midasin-like protein n=1 Tax=Phytophthora cinnamomi TaxID=4785 RepID=UPI003559F494|nr:midasin-like protein [Phytophthora cinnamomi]